LYFGANTPFKKHASTFNHFNLDRHLNSRSDFKQSRSAALAEWRQLAA
jgi:putative transposase